VSAEPSPVARAAAGAPHAPGVYFFLGRERELLYVGKAVDLRRRLTDHARSRTARSAHVREIQWELCDDADAALAREADLIVALRPTFNASYTDQDPDQYVAVEAGPGDGLTFRLTSKVSDTRTYGCFPHLAKGAFSHPAKVSKLGFTALLRLLWTAQPGGQAGGLPKRIGGTAPPARHEARVPVARRAALHDYLSGRSPRLVAQLIGGLPDSTVPPFMHPALERDADLACAFFDIGPRRLRQLRLRHGIPPGPITADVFACLLASEIEDSIGKVRFPPRSDPSTPLLGRRAARSRRLRESAATVAREVRT
jgi:hypothetical protein